MARASLKNQQIMLEALNKSISAMAKNMETLTKAQVNANKETDKGNKSLKEQAKELMSSGKAFTRRASIVKTAAKETNGVLNLGKKSFDNYKKAGGTAFEYFAMFFAGTSEQLRVFNLEVASLRRIAFGFLPRGTFRMFNQFATYLNGFGSALRVLRGDAKDAEEDLFGKKKGFFSQFAKYDEILASGKMDRLTGKSLSKQAKEMKELGLDSTSDVLRKKSVEMHNKGDAQRVAGIKGYLNIATAGAFEGGSEKIGGLTTFGQTTDPVTGEKRRKTFADTPLGKMIGGIVKGFRAFMAFYAAKGIGKLIKLAAGFVIKSAIIFFRFTILASVALMGLFAAFMILKPAIMAAWDFMSSVIGPFLGFIAEGFMDIWDGIQEIYQGFVEGDLFAVIGGVWTIAWGLLQVALGALVGLLAVAFAFIGGLVWGAITGFIEYIFDFSGGIMNNLDKIVVMAAVVLGLIFGFPVVFALAVVTAIGVLLSKIGLFADGGVTGGGVSIVGEKGPELVRLPAGSRVSSAQKTRTMLSSNNSGGNTFNITINAKDTSDGEMRRIADKIGKMINNKINRNVGASSIR